MDEKKKKLDEKKIDKEQLNQIVGGIEIGSPFFDELSDVINGDDIVRSEPEVFSKEPNMRDPYFPHIIKWQ